MELINKGSKAGGYLTNVVGKYFENKTNNEHFLLLIGFQKKEINDAKHGYYLEKKYRDKTIIYVLQTGFKIYMKEHYNIDMFRCPDEAYIITYKRKKPINVKIIEKKAQNVDGSVETKLWAGNSLKREYEMVLGDKFSVDYAYTLSSYLENKLKSDDYKYYILTQILNESNINIFYGEADNYISEINDWIGT
jgi:hypothetical protein